MAELVPLDGVKSDNFGQSVAISGDTAAVGIHGDDTGARTGAVLVFRRTGDRTWHRVARLLSSDAEIGDSFGGAVEVADAGRTVVAGATGNDDQGDQSGSAYVFEWVGGGVWRETAKLLAADVGAEDKFGSSVAMDGDTLVIGAPSGSDGWEAGAAYVFERAPWGDWWEVAVLLASDPTIQHYFGSAVDISGDTVVVGARLDDELGSNSGAAYIFERDDSGTWTEVDKLLAWDGESDQFGHSVAIDRDGLVIGAYYNDGPVTNAGAAYVFERDSGGAWTGASKLVASDAEEHDLFGISVGISGNAVVVGSYWDDDMAFASGAAYLFERDEVGAWTEIAKLLASDGEYRDQLGYEVAIDGDTAVAGAPGEDVARGSAYVFSVAAESRLLRLPAPPASGSGW